MSCAAATCAARRRSSCCTATCTTRVISDGRDRHAHRVPRRVLLRSIERDDRGLQRRHRRAFPQARQRRCNLDEAAALQRQAARPGGARADARRRHEDGGRSSSTPKRSRPPGDPNFQSEADRAAIVTLHRWSFLDRDREAATTSSSSSPRTSPSSRRSSSPIRRSPSSRCRCPIATTRKAAVARRRQASRREGRHALRRDHRRPEGHPDHLDPHAAAGQRGGVARARGVHHQHPHRSRHGASARRRSPR